jgi:hypothetical protein
MAMPVTGKKEKSIMEVGKAETKCGACKQEVKLPVKRGSRKPFLARKHEVKLVVLADCVADASMFIEQALSRQFAHAEGGYGTARVISVNQFGVPVLVRPGQKIPLL